MAKVKKSIRFVDIKKKLNKNRSSKEAQVLTRKIFLQTPRGMRDILFEEADLFEKVEKVIKNLASFYNYNKIELPCVEYSDIFTHGIGQETDIVQKEMYWVKSKSDDDKKTLVLRPEGTAGVVRAYIQHGMFSLPQPVKLYYYGPMFRHDKPQLGRYRQLYQFGFEVIGDNSPIIDVELIFLGKIIFNTLKLKNFKLEINSIGCQECRKKYIKDLKKYYRTRKKKLCDTCRSRLENNPLRILDCKEEQCKNIRMEAPNILDYLCVECNSHFKTVLSYLDELKINYSLNPYLVRGLDYYTKTVWEISSEDNENLGALMGGGRYDGLLKLFSGQDRPACGFAIGLDRVVEAIKSQKKEWKEEKKPEIFLVQVGETAKKQSLELLEELRTNNIRVSFDLSRDSLRSQMKLADKLGAKYVLLLGQTEVLRNEIILRDMQSGLQENIPLNKLIKMLKTKI